MMKLNGLSNYKILENQEPIQVKSNQTNEPALIRAPFIKSNLIIMIFQWSCTSLSYYTLSFLVKYMPGDIYENIITLGFSEMVATFVSGIIYSKFGIIKSFSIAHILTIVGSIGVIFTAQIGFLTSYLFILRVGLDTGFILVYFGNADVFPTLF